MINKGLFNVEFSMSGHFGQGTMVIDDPSLLTDALAEFERTRQAFEDLLDEPYTADPSEHATNDALIFGWHRAEIIIIPRLGGSGLQITVNCKDGPQLSVNLARIGD